MARPGMTAVHQACCQTRRVSCNIVPQLGCSASAMPRLRKLSAASARMRSDGETGNDCRPPGLLPDEASVLQHRSPARVLRIRDAKTEETECCFSENEIGWRDRE